MKFNVLINSRSHPEGLITTCMYLAHTAQDITNIKFSIRADLDDVDTIVAAQRLSNYMNVSLSYGPRPRSMGAEHNHMAKNTPADVAYLVMNDTLFPCSIVKSAPSPEHPTAEVSMGWWDTFLEKVIEEHVDREMSIFCWHLTAGKTGDYPIITKKWYDAAGFIFPEYFPFWFDDQWLMALHCMVHKSTFARIEPLLVHAPKSFVQRMRNNMVWVEFYQSMEAERIAQASKIRAAMGMDPIVPQDNIDIVRGYEARFHSEFAEKETRLGDKREPDSSYLAALEFAINTIEQKKANNEPTFYEGFKEQEPVQPKRRAKRQNKVGRGKSNKRRPNVRRVRKA